MSNGFQKELPSSHVCSEDIKIPESPIRFQFLSNLTKGFHFVHEG